MFKIRLVLAIVYLLVLALSIISDAEYYYLISYGACNNDDVGCNVLLRRIDLDSAKVTDSILISIGGIILNEKPIHLLMNGEPYLLGFAGLGMFAKNSGPGNFQINYKIIRIDSTLTAVKSDSFMGCMISQLAQYPNENTFQFGIEIDSNRAMLLEDGSYAINQNYNFVRVDSIDSDNSSGKIKKIGEFEYLKPVNSPNKHNLYFANGGTGYWLLRLNSKSDTIIDSVRLQTGMLVSTIFAYHPLRDKFYCFYLNYECHSKFPELIKNYKEDWSTPEVLIFNPETLELIKKDNVADFLQDNYPYMAEGLADVVGDYIVYYFFDDERISMLFPAMLFIFDTRNNTAKWLNVGWR
jgi:hypothetical protein